MKSRIRVDVEPLSEARWRKVDEAVFAAIEAPSLRPAALSSSRRRWAAPAAVGVLALAAAVAIYIQRSDAPAPLASSHIVTGTARSLVQLGFASVDVGPASELTTSGDDQHGVVVVLEHGSVDCEVARRHDRPPFVVQAGTVRVSVVGTHFTVRRELDGTTVLVTRGIVDVSYDGKITHVSAGQSWPAPEPSASATSLEAPAVSSPPLAPSSAASLPSSVSSSATLSAPHARPSDQSLYEQAAQLERRDPDGATAIYQRLANKGGPWAPSALFAAGRLASERGNRSEATRLLQQYLDRYPSGANAEDARRLLSGLR